MDSRDYKFYVSAPYKTVYGSNGDSSKWKAYLFRRDRVHDTWKLIFETETDTQTEVFLELSKFIYSLGIREEFEVKEW